MALRDDEQGSTLSVSAVSELLDAVAAEPDPDASGFSAIVGAELPADEAALLEEGSAQVLVDT